MHRFFCSVLLLISISPVFAQESLTIVKVPSVEIVDSKFSLMISTIIQDAESCSFTKEIPCGIIARKMQEKSGQYCYCFSIAPFDELELLVESYFGTKKWRTITINGIQIIFLYDDLDKFNTIDSTEIIINQYNRVIYQYAYVNNDTIDVTKLQSHPLCLQEFYLLEDDEYRLQHKDQCIDITKGEKKSISKSKILYVIRE